MRETDEAMSTLITGMIVLYGMHLVPYTPLKAGLNRALGEKGYRIGFALVSLAGLVIMVKGFGLTRQGPDAARIVYDSPAWAFEATRALVLLGFISLTASFFKGRLKLWLKNPMSIGIALWASGHLISNGALGEVLFFGGFLALGLLDIIVSTMRGDRPTFAPTLRHDIIAPVLGTVLFGLVVWLHPMLFGASVL